MNVAFGSKLAPPEEVDDRQEGHPPTYAGDRRDHPGGSDHRPALAAGEHATAARADPVPPPDRGGRTLIPVRGQPSSIVNPFRRKSLSSATEEESSCAPVWEHSSLRRTCCRLPLRPLRAGPRFARLKPTPRGRSSCTTVAMASGGLFIGAKRRGANGFGFGGARRTDEFEPAQVRGCATPPEGAYLMQNSRCERRVWVESPPRNRVPSV